MHALVLLSINMHALVLLSINMHALVLISINMHVNVRYTILLYQQTQDQDEMDFENSHTCDTYWFPSDTNFSIITITIVSRRSSFTLPIFNIILLVARHSAAILMDYKQLLYSGQDAAHI